MPAAKEILGTPEPWLTKRYRCVLPGHGHCLIQLGGFSLDQCKTFANWWAAAQAVDLGPIMLVIARCAR
jgi:hypothetical protein